MNKLLVSLLVLLLTGCNAQNIKPNHQFSETANNGIILVSASQDIGSGTKAAYSIFYIDHQEGGRFSLLGSREKTAFGFKESEFSDTNGKLYALDAPVGDYIISYWQINNGTGKRITPKGKPAGIEFNVKKGEIVYIGNLHMKLQTGENFFGMDITGGGYPFISDEFDRDYKLFINKYNTLSKAPYRKQVSFTGAWVKD